MKKKFSLVLSFPLFVLLFVQFASASSVTRYLPDSAYPGQVIDVTLDVSLTGGESYYLLDEEVPSGWAIINHPEDTEEGHMKWVVIQNAVSKSYSYQAMAPQNEGTYTFSGTYMIEGMRTEGSVGGDDTIAVRSAAAYKPGFDTLIVPIVILASLIITVIIYKSRSRRASSGTPKAEVQEIVEEAEAPKEVRREPHREGRPARRTSHRKHGRK